MRSRPATTPPRCNELFDETTSSPRSFDRQIRSRRGLVIGRRYRRPFEKVRDTVPVARAGGSRVLADERRAAIAELAGRVFAEKGYYGTSTVGVAREAGISHAYVFRLFPLGRASVVRGCAVPP
jgi:hypothetical protein